MLIRVACVLGLVLALSATMPRAASADSDTVASSDTAVAHDAVPHPMKPGWTSWFSMKPATEPYDFSGLFAYSAVLGQEIAEHLRVQVQTSVSPWLEVSSSFNPADFGLRGKPGQYWMGFRLPKEISRLNLERDFGFMSEELNKTNSNLIVPLGAGLRLPFEHQRTLTVTFLMNVAPVSSTPVLPSLTVGFRF